MTSLQWSKAPVVAVLAMLAAGCDISVGEHGLSMDIASGKAQDEWTRTYTVPATGSLEIVNVNGRIEASPAEGSQVEVRAERIAKAGNDEAARELLKTIEIAEDQSGDRLRLETRVPKGTWGRSSHEVRYFVKVPRGLAVTLQTVNGGVRLDDLQGRLTATTTNGGVRGSGLRGGLKATTTNGGVQIEMAAVTDDVEIETTNGGIRLQLPPDVKANLDARCTNGGIGVSGFSVDGEQTRRRAAGTINGGGPRVSVDVTNGGIRISPSGERGDRGERPGTH